MSNTVCLDCGEVHRCNGKGADINIRTWPSIGSGSVTANDTNYTVTQIATDGTVAK